MPKKQILSKFKIKDYNAELEKILEEKDFSSQVKNLLLSMFYKLEIGYNDYEIVKHNVPSKEVFMEYMMGIIKEKCNELCKCIMDDLANFDKDLKRVIQNDRTETDFFKVQTNSLNDDKIKLQKETISLQARMRSCEIDIGVEPKS